MLRLSVASSHKVLDIVADLEKKVERHRYVKSF